MRIKNRRLVILTTVVVAAHLFFFFFDFKSAQHLPPPKKSIVVRTFPSRTKIVANSKKIHQSNFSTKLENPKPKIKSRKDKMLKELKDSITKIEKRMTPQEKSVLTVPKNIQSLAIDQLQPIEASDYFVLLGQTLKEELELPEYGDVRLELTVQNGGRVLKIRVLQAASEKNRRYLELNLPKVILPPFDKDFKNKQQHTFTLTFCNEV